MKLMFLNGPQAGQMADVPPTGVTIGRENDNTVQLPMGGVSRYHAKIERNAAGIWQIRDLGSTNGTLVDDVPVNGLAALSSGSVISIGDQLLRCIDPDSMPSPAPAPAPAAAPASSVQSAPAQPPPVQPSPVQPSPVQPPSQPSSPTFFFRPGVSSTTQTQVDAVNEPKKPDFAPASPSAQTISAVPTDVTRGLFNKKTPAGSSKPDRPRKLLGNAVFAFLVILAACLGLWIFLKLSETTHPAAQQPTVKKKVENPFTLYYEKESVSGTSVFRFTLLVELGQQHAEEGEPQNKRAYVMAVTLDEPQNRRRYYELFKEPLPDELIAKLKQQIQESGFMELQPEKIAGTSLDNRQHRRIMVGFDSKFCDVKVSNDVSETFNRVESIINETLLDEYDLGIVSQDVDRILKDAQSFLFIAEEAFRGIDTTPSNLPKAIANYKLALRRYQLFDDPKPVEWKTARDGLAKAEAKLEEIRQEGNRNVKLYYEQREYAKAIAECNRLLEIFPPDSKTYQAIRETRIKIERKLSVRNN